MKKCKIIFEIFSGFSFAFLISFLCCLFCRANPVLTCIFLLIYIFCNAISLIIDSVYLKSDCDKKK